MQCCLHVKHQRPKMMLRVGVNPVPWPCCSGRLLLPWHRWEQFLGAEQSKELHRFNISASTLRTGRCRNQESGACRQKMWNIYKQSDGSDRRNPSVYPDKSRTQLTDGKCPNPVLQYPVFTFNFVHRSYRYSQSISKLLPMEENSPLSILCQWTMFTAGSRGSFPISNAESDFRPLKIKLSDSAGVVLTSQSVTIITQHRKWEI